MGLTQGQSAAKSDRFFHAAFTLVSKSNANSNFHHDIVLQSILVIGLFEIVDYQIAFNSK